jgi:O-antigen/teichoic acid export membrane protein
VSATEVGIFGAATRLALLVSFLLITLNNVIAPKFAELHAKDDLQALAQLARRSAAMLTLLVSPLFLLLFIYSEETMALFGSEFSAGDTILAILLGGQLINVVTGSVNFLLMMSGNEKTMRNIIIASAILQLVLVFTLVPLIGGVGAAIASATAVAAKNLVTVYAVYRKLGIVTIPGVQMLLSNTRCK